VSRYQRGKTNLDFTEARDSEWQWHQLGHKQVCTSLQTDNHASTPPLKVYTGRMPFLPPNQQRQSTEGTRRLTSDYAYKLQINFQCNKQIYMSSDADSIKWSYHSIKQLFCMLSLSSVSKNHLAVWLVRSTGQLFTHNVTE